MDQPNPIPGEPTPNPSRIPEVPDKQVQPNVPEIDPGKPATETEVDLDTQKNQTYPNENPPERH